MTLSTSYLRVERPDTSERRSRLAQATSGSILVTRRCNTSALRFGARNQENRRGRPRCRSLHDARPPTRGCARVLVSSGWSSSSRSRELWTARPLFVSTGGRAPLSGFAYRALGFDPAPALQSGPGILLEGVYPDTPIRRCRPVRGGLAARTRPHRHPASHGCLEESRRRASAGRLQRCGYAFRTTQCFHDALQCLPVARRHLQGRGGGGPIHLRPGRKGSGRRRPCLPPWLPLHLPPWPR